MKYCSKCGKGSEDFVVFCSNCGERIGEAAIAQQESIDGLEIDTREASAGWIWLGIAGGVGCIITGAILKNKRWKSMGKKLLIGGIIGVSLETAILVLYFAFYVFIFLVFGMYY